MTIYTLLLSSFSQTSNFILRYRENVIKKREGLAGDVGIWRKVNTYSLIQYEASVSFWTKQSVYEPTRIGFRGFTLLFHSHSTHAYSMRHRIWACRYWEEKNFRCILRAHDKGQVSLNIKPFQVSIMLRALYRKV